MIVQLTLHEAQVVEADDLGRLHISTSLQPGDVEPALLASRIGTTFENGRALLTIDSLRAMAAGSATVEGWNDKWESMLGYARSRGWVSDDQSGVWAHIEFLDSDQASSTASA